MLSAADGAIGIQYRADDVKERLKENGEARDVAGDLTWTEPFAGPDADVTLATVDKYPGSIIST